jgi:hypothetical protein
LAVHAVLLAMLAVWSFARLDPAAEIELSIGPETMEEIAFADAEFESDIQPDEIAEEALIDPIDPGLAALGMEADRIGALTDPLALTADGDDAESPQNAMGDVGALFGDEGRGLGEFGSGLGDSPIAEFFGAKIEGRRIVFVLDNSGSMQAGRLETVIAELEKCVASLSADQEFYVIFYSDVAYPLFYPDPIAQFIRPTERNKKLLAEWLEGVELCLGDAVLDALNAAAAIRPDTVFLLSDGRIYGERKMQALLTGGSDAFPIHTVGVGLGGGATARRNLQDIAAANGGVFREADIPDAMREVARQRPRPYHVDGPGPIWGRNVRVRPRVR